MLRLYYGKTSCYVCSRICCCRNCLCSYGSVVKAVESNGRISFCPSWCCCPRLYGGVWSQGTFNGRAQAPLILTILNYMKTVYYYQTFVGLHQLMSHAQDIDVIIISSIHFTPDSQGNPQIYLNDNSPYDSKFTQVWNEAEHLYNQGVTIQLMIGGAGGAFTELFSKFTEYYPLLKQVLSTKTFIGGIDLDIEETVDINNIKMLIRLLKHDFPEFKITMAPLASSLTNDSPGMGGFSYKTLYKSYEERLIDSFHVQCYDSFSYNTFRSIVNNGYPPEKIIMGMESGQFTSDTFPQALDEVKQIIEDYPEMGGVYDWEYLNAPPDTKDPSQWCKYMKQSDLLQW